MQQNVGYEIEGIIQILKSLSNAKRGFLIESIWKYLVYSELLKSIYNNIIQYPSYKELKKSEEKIIEFINKNESIILPEFSVRLDSIVKHISVLDNDDSNGIQDYQLKVSELIHKGIINELRVIIGDYCVDKQKVVILIDNLDKAWQSGSDIEILSNFLFGLLDVGNSIIRDFARENNWKKPVNLSLIIFLREDIFTLMAKYVPERDKLSVERILWEDKEILLRVIEERMQMNQNIDIWKKYFCINVDNSDVKSFIVNNILPRPRDIITLVKAALGNAVNHKHTLIEETDLKNSIKIYSKFALETLITEVTPEYPQIRELVYEFVGEDRMVTEIFILEKMENIGIEDSRRQLLISMLCKMSFLGLEIKDNEFLFCYNEDDYNKYYTIAKKIASKKGNTYLRFKIHNAFHEELMIESIPS